MFDIRDTHTLLMLVKEVPPLNTFLLDRYFPSNQAKDVFSTTDVLVEYKDGNKKAAPFVAPRHGGITVMRDGHTMSRLTPGKIGVKRTITEDELAQRGFGEALYSQLTPAQRQGAMILSDLDDMRTMNIRRREAMAAEVIFTNGCIMKEYADDLTVAREREVRYYEEGTNPAQYTPSATWDLTEESGKKMLNDLAAMVRMLSTRGLAATDVLVAPDVADVILGNAYIQKLLDNRRMEMGGIAPELLPSGAAKIARLNVKGRMLDILTYEDTYEEVDGTVKPYIPAGKIAVGAAGAGRTVFGAITQVEQHDGQFHTYTGTDIPKYISDPTSNVRTVELVSAPLCIPRNRNAFISATVL